MTNITEWLDQEIAESENNLKKELHNSDHEEGWLDCLMHIQRKLKEVAQNDENLQKAMAHLSSPEFSADDADHIHDTMKEFLGV